MKKESRLGEKRLARGEQPGWRRESGGKLQGGVAEGGGLEEKRG